MTDPINAGAIVHEAVEAAGKLHRVDTQFLTDPRDGTEAPFVFSNAGAKVIDPELFDKYRDSPLGRSGTATLGTLDSFIAHVARFKSGDSAIYARDSMESAGLLAIYDYHPAGEDEAQAANCRHRAAYNFPFSDEWKAWHGKDGEPMTMADFAEFLESRIVDVVADAEPASDAAKQFVGTVGGKLATPTKLVELSRGLQVYENSVLKESRKLGSGEGQLTFEASHTDADGKPIDVPSLFMIQIPIFARSPDAYRLLARLRYRKTQAGVVFWYDLWRADLAFEQAFSEACAKVCAETELPLFVGAPEV